MTISIHSPHVLRYSSTNSSNDEKDQNEETKNKLTNLMYIGGGLTGVIAIYSLVCICIRIFT